MSIYIFHLRYLHNDIFRYMTCVKQLMKFQGCYFTVLCKLITLHGSYSNWPNFSIFLVFTATFLWYSFSTWLEQLLKYQLGCLGAPTTNFTLWVTCHLVLTNYSSEDI